MTNGRHFGNDAEGSLGDQLDLIKQDEAFIDALSLGKDPSDGKDPLASLLLTLKEDVDRDMPAAPTLAELGIEEELPDGVVSLDARRKRRSGAFTHGLVGAAAATLIIGGFGTAIHAAEPGQALYGLNQQLFGNSQLDSQVVELASTLDEANQKSAAGDAQGARELLDQARLLVSQMEKGKQAEAKEKISQVETKIVTTTVPTTVQAPAPAPAEPATVTVTVTYAEQAPAAPVTTDSAVEPVPSEDSVAPVAPVEPAQPAPAPTEEGGATNPQAPVPSLPLQVPGN